MSAEVEHERPIKRPHHQQAGWHPEMISSPKPETRLFFALVVLTIGLFAGCSKGDGSVTAAGSANSSSPPQIGVTVAPAAASISTKQPQQFTATVVNSTNPAVIWRVDGVQGGNATVE